MGECVGYCIGTMLVQAWDDWISGRGLWGESLIPSRPQQLPTPPRRTPAVVNAGSRDRPPPRTSSPTHFDWDDIIREAPAILRQRLPPSTPSAVRVKFDAFLAELRSKLRSRTSSSTSPSTSTVVGPGHVPTFSNPPPRDPGVWQKLVVEHPGGRHGLADLIKRPGWQYATKEQSKKKEVDKALAKANKRIWDEQSRWRRERFANSQDPIRPFPSFLEPPAWVPGNAHQADDDVSATM